MLESKQKKFGKVFKKLTKIESEEIEMQTLLEKEIVEMKRNLETYQKAGNRTRLSSVRKGWKVESLHTPTTLMDVQRLNRKAAENWRIEVDEKWMELKGCLERWLKIGQEVENKPEGWTKSEHKDSEAFNDLTVYSYECKDKVEFDEQSTIDSYKSEDEMQRLCKKPEMHEDMKKEESLEEFRLALMGVLAPCLRTLDVSTRRKFFGARVCRVTFKHLPQPLRSHTQSFGTLGKLLNFSKKNFKKT